MDDLAVTVYGASLDGVEDLERFAKAQELAFGLLSDPDGSAAAKYGVLAGRFARRITFVIDEEGVIRHIDRQVQVDTHGADLGRIIAKLQG